MLAAALAYAGRSWPVVPIHSWIAGHCSCRSADCTSPAKHPHTANGLTDASTDAEVVRRWWRRWPLANVGLATGRAFDVLDVDGAAGLLALNDAMACYGPATAANDAVDPCLDGPTAATGRDGGYHVLITPAGRGNATGVGGLDHVDYRGRGGYIVAPPSLHASGRRYRWLAGWGPDDVAICAPPDWLATLLATGAGPRWPAGTSVPPGGRKAAYGRGALNGELAAVALVPEGSRNDVLNRASHALGRLVAGGIVDRDGACDSLLLAGRRAGLGEAEAERTIRSGMAAGMASPRRVAS